MVRVTIVFANDGIMEPENTGHFAAKKRLGKETVGGTIESNYRLNSDAGTAWRGCRRQAEGLGRRRRPHSMPEVRVVSAQHGSMEMQMPACVEHLRHRRSLPGMPEAMGHDRVPGVPSMVSAFGLVPEVLKRRRATSI
jgi:hypothetical protein